MKKKFDYSYRNILAESEFSSFSLNLINTEYKEKMRRQKFFTKNFKP